MGSEEAAMSFEEAAKTYGWNQIKSNDFSIHKKRKGRYAVIYLKGDYYEAASAFEKLLAFIEEQNLQMGEFCYKEAIWDELTVAEVGEYITKISIEVEG